MFMTAASPLSKQIAARAADRTGGIKQIAEGRSDVFKLNPFKIEVEPGFNVRDFGSTALEEHVDGLAQSIAKIGVQRPLKIRNKGNRFVLVDGECRLRAVVRAIEVYGAEIHTIPVTVADRGLSDADAVLGILVENSGLDVTPLGKAEVVKRLTAFGWSEADIAEKAGLSKGRVGQLLSLMGLGEEIKKLIRADKISATTALQVARDNGFDDEKTLAAIKAGATVAAERGKTRVTAKSVASPKATETIGGIISGADVEYVSGEDETVILTISKADYAVMCAALKITMASDD